MPERNAHRIIVTGRVFSRLAWPTRTDSFEKETSCPEAESMAQKLRDLGAVCVTVDHLHEAEVAGV